MRTADGDALAAAAVVAASGSFGNPYLPVLPGREGFAGRQLHVADYREPERYAGQRVVVVGGGNSAVQVGYELAKVASVTLATRQPIVFFPQILHGRDVHHWLTTSGFDDPPPEWLARIVGTRFVMEESPRRTSGWSTWGWSSNGRSRPTRCAESTATPSTSWRRSPPTCATRPPRSACEAIDVCPSIKEWMT